MQTLKTLTNCWKLLLPLQLVVLFCSSLAAQQSSSQYFMLTFPSTATVEGMQSDPIQLTFDDTKVEQQFPLQRWSIGSSNNNGVEVLFTALPFTSTQEPGFKSNTKISIALASSTGPATWNIQTGIDQTDYTINKQANTSALSNNPGKGVFDVGVSCLVELGTLVPSGSLQTQVFATVTAR